jgi:hypothetical protein
MVPSLIVFCPHLIFSLLGIDLPIVKTLVSNALRVHNCLHCIDQQLHAASRVLWHTPG